MPLWAIVIGIASIAGFLATHWKEQQNASKQQSVVTSTKELEWQDLPLQQRPLKVTTFSSLPDANPATTSNDTSTGVTPPSASSNQAPSESGPFTTTTSTGPTTLTGSDPATTTPSESGAFSAPSA